MKIYNHYLIGALTLFFLSSINLSAEEMDAKEVLSKIHQTNKAEMELGKLAQEKGQSQEVKEFGEKIFNEHKAADDKVTAMAESMDIELAEPELTDKQKKTKQKLQELSGTEFDQKFVKVMEKDHKKAISMLNSAAEDTEDQELKKFVNSLLPTFKQHHHAAREEKKELSKQAQEAE